MKRFLAILLLAFMLASVVACADTQGDNFDESLEVVGDSSKPNESTEIESESNESSESLDISEESDTFDESVWEDEKEFDGEFFQIGYSRADITPDEPVYLDERTLLDEVKDPIYATCVAAHDGENTVLIYTIDTKNIGPDEAKQIRAQISSATKVPSENIMISPTHNHSVPKLGVLKNRTGNLNWTAKVHNALVTAGREAIADLADAKIYAATGKTTGMAFVRRYLLADGTYTGIHNGNRSTAPIVDYESEADDTVQVIRFVRDDKKDVLIANWQCHVASAINENPRSITADVVGLARDWIENRDKDVLFALYIGASGNINLNAKVAGTQVYTNYVQVGRALGRVIIETCEDMERVHAGDISVSYKNLEVEIRKDDEITVSRANEIALLREGSRQYYALLYEYGFNSKYEVEAIIKRANAGKSENFYIAALSFGDLGFVSVPYEMFDTNGMQVKEGSPFKMTFVLTNADGWAAYIPSAEAIPHGGYEVYTTRYVFGTAERVVEELLGMLKEQVK